MTSPDAILKTLRTAACFLLVIFSRAAYSENGDDWSRRAWQLDEGLPSANITGIAQTHDGYLWLATQTGLTRFDGSEFDVIPVPVGRPRPFILTMLLDHAENFWVAEREGSSLIARFGHGAPRLFTPADGLPDAQPEQLLEAGDHAVWICYGDGSVYRIAPDDHITCLTAADGLPEDGICSLTLDVQGILWFAKGSQYGYWRENHFEKAGDLQDHSPLILGARNGGLWFCTSTQVMRAVSNLPPVAVATFQEHPDHSRPSAMFEDFNGRLWIGTVAEGLFQLEHTNIFKVETSQNRIRTIFRDHEGSLWVGTDGGGLDRIFPKAVELRGRDEGLPFETVRSLAEGPDGDLWVVTQDGALTRLAGGDWSSAQPVGDWPGGIAHDVVMDQQGVIWIGTYRRGLLRWRDGKFSRVGLQAGLGGITIRSLLVDHRGDLWIGLENEPMVQRMHDGHLESFSQPTNSRAVRAMAEDVNGQIWFGTLDGRLLHLTGDRLEEIAAATTEPEHPIRCLSATPDGNLWIGYAAYGVCRLKNGKISHVSMDDGLFDGNICSMMPDTYGRMWFASDRGIFFVPIDQLNEFADGKIPHVQSIYYGRDAGLPSVQAYYGYWPGALTTKEGDILFPTHSGIAIVHPKHVRSNGTPPNVLIQNIAVDGKEIAWRTNSTAELLPNHRKIEITFTAPSFIAPEQVRFRHRMLGWSDDWSEEQRDRTAVFPRLPPGDYTFQVTACNNNGVWNENGVNFKFTVTPFFWQSWVFRSVIILILLAVIVGVVRHLMLQPVRELVRRVEQEAALQKERTRIAQDMHDELGARFTQISLLGELSTGALAEPDKVRDFLGQISRVARSGVKSLDEIVWAVNPRNDTLSDLLDYTGQFAREFLAAANIECRLDFPDALPEMKVSGEIRHSVFLIVKETLNNTVKHAQAARVKITFELEAGVMHWRIEDDGKGFVTAPDNALADGLRNIRQRAVALAGSADIQSFPGKGTRVTMEIPLPKS